MRYAVSKRTIVCNQALTAIQVASSCGGVPTFFCDSYNSSHFSSVGNRTRAETWWCTGGWCRFRNSTQRLTSGQVIEEDLIFPCAEPPEFKTPRASPTLQPRQTRSFSRSTAGSNGSGLDEGYTAGPSHDIYLHQSHVRNRSLDTISGRRSEYRDHTRLKEAFLQMLSSRFINSGVLTILPFYLQSAFQDVQIFPPVKLYLPSPTGVVQPIDQSDSTSSFSLDSSSTLVEAESSSRQTSHADQPANNYRARLYLARTLAVMRGCMETLWMEYERLYRFERTKPNTRLDRDDFESYFYNWEWYGFSSFF